MNRPPHTIHEAGCPKVSELPIRLIEFRAAVIPQLYPDAHACTCISHETVRMNRLVVAEPREVEQ